MIAYFGYLPAMLRRLAIAAVIAASVAACSEGAPQPAPTVTVTATPAATTDAGPTIRQYVSIVEILKSKILEQQKLLHICPQPDRVGRLGCGEVANHAVGAAVDTYANMKSLGVPPDHIAKLVKQTMDAASLVVSQMPDPPVFCNLKVSTMCDRYEKITSRNVDDLVDILAGWKPYE